MATFRFTVDADEELASTLRRHLGARRFAYNQCLRAVKDALDRRRLDERTEVPWSSFSLINWFNAWKHTEEAGRVCSVDPSGQAEICSTGLAWRNDVCAQVFEEAAVDLGRALRAHSAQRRNERPGPRVGFPRFNKKGRCSESFRLRSKISPSGRPSIRVGEGAPRSVTLPVIGAVPLREDTRRLRRLVRPDAAGRSRGRVCVATVKEHRGRFVVLLTCELPDFHPARRHPEARGAAKVVVGLDRGLTAYVVGATADREELVRIGSRAPLARRLPRLRKLSRAASRSCRGSNNQQRNYRALRRLHHSVADRRSDFLHRLSSELVQTHDALCIEDLAVANLVRNRYLARAVADASWGGLARLLAYKSAWYGTELIVAPRFYPSSKACSRCGWLWKDMAFSDRVFSCRACGVVCDRDLNAAANLAAFASAEHASEKKAPDPQARAGSPTPVEGPGAGRQIAGGGTGPETSPSEKKQEPASATSAA